MSTQRKKSGSQKPLRDIPRFKSEAEEFDFWSTHDFTDYLDLSQAKRTVFPNLKPSGRSISLRLPDAMLDDLKIIANQRDVPYQSLIKMILASAIERNKPKHV